MARSISSAKLLSAIVAEKISIAATSRGYAAAAASQGINAAVGRSGMMGKKAGEEAKSSPWVPDPVTGYYRPESHANEIDVAELREMLLKNKVRQH